MATVAERQRDAAGSLIDRDGLKPPPGVADRIKRGRDRMKSDEQSVNECLAFWRGKQYVHVSDENYLVKQSTVSNQDGTGKPRHRIRRTYNIITPVVGHKVSAATSRTPDYEINPATVDPEDEDAAKLSGKVARFGYDEWNVRSATVSVVTFALVAPGGGFAWPFFDTQIGPFVSDGEQTVGVGDVRIRTFGPNEVYWEPGIKFEESRWHAVEQARPLEEVRGLPDFIGGELKADAQGATGKSQEKLVMVTDYLERPSARKSEGQWLTLAGGKLITRPKPFPCQDEKGKPVDEPVLHHLSFIQDPGSDRDMALVPFLLDPQRSYNNANCKQLEWVQIALNPQLIVKNGKLKQRMNDVPGAVFEYWGGGDVQWRPVPPMPAELQQVKEDARGIVQFIAADQDIPQGVESGQAIQTVIERDQSVWEHFYSNLAEFHSRLMRHCLYLVQRYYTEPRLLKVSGRFGGDAIEGFMGAQLRGQADVTVLPGSVEPRTRKQIEQKVFAFADRMWISPEAAMAAINGGTAESLVESYELDISRAHRIIRRIKAGPEALFSRPEVVTGQEPQTVPDPSGMPDPNTGMPGQVPNPEAGKPKMGPDWMPRYADNLKVFKSIFDDWFKTTEYEDLAVPMQEAANQIYQGILQLQAQKDQEAAMAQEQQAQGLGMKNAAKTQGPPSQPDQPTPDSPPGQSAPPTPNQPADQSVPQG